MLIERIAAMGLKPAASAAGISMRTARKWYGRFKQFGLAGLLDRSSRPHKTRSTVDAALCRRIEQLRRARMPMRTIAAIVGRSVATISRVLAQQGLSSLKALDPASQKCPRKSAQRYKMARLLARAVERLLHALLPTQTAVGRFQHRLGTLAGEFILRLAFRSA